MGPARALHQLGPAGAQIGAERGPRATGGTFLVLALIPIIAALIGDESGFGLGLAICAGLGLLAAPLLFALAAWVAAKV